MFKKWKSKKRLLLLLGILFIPIFALTTILFTLSNYVVGENKKNDSQVGSPVINFSVLDENRNIDVTNRKTIYTKRFNIMNYTNNKVNEVQLIYFLEIKYIEVDANDIQIVLKKNNNIISITDNITEKFLLQVDEKQIDEYELTLEYKTSSSESRNGRVEVTLHSYQALPMKGE